LGRVRVLWELEQSPIGIAPNHPFWSLCPGNLLCQPDYISSYIVGAGVDILLLDAMASNLPIPRPPRTPTPPSDDPTSVTDGQPQRGFAVSYDKDVLSPMVDNFSQNGLNVEDRDRLSPTRSSFKLSPTDGSVQNGASGNGSAGPFNFQTTTMAKGPVMKSVSACFNCTFSFIALER
jgi:hypothetical protein